MKRATGYLPIALVLACVPVYLGIEVERLHGVAVGKLLLNDGYLNALSEIAVEKADNLLRGTLDAVALRHVDGAVGKDKVGVGAGLPGAVAHAGGGDDILNGEMASNLLAAEVSERLRVGKRVRDGNHTLAGGSVDGADVAVGNVQLDGVGDGDSGVGHGGKLVRHDVSP